MTTGPTNIGWVQATGVYRIDLGSLGVPLIGSIVLSDDNVIAGGTGAASGFDLDFIKISDQFTSDAATAAGLVSTVPTPAGTILERGYMRPWAPGEPEEWNLPRLFSTNADGSVNLASATLGTRDGSNLSGLGSVSLGEGGRITLIFDTPFAAAGSYLYIGDTGSGLDDSLVSVSASTVFSPRSGLTVIGSPGADDIRLGTGVNALVGGGDDSVTGLAGNDVISTAGGDDVIRPGLGNDTADGGDGFDVVVMETGRSGVRIDQQGPGWTVTSNQGVDALADVERLDLSDAAFDFTNPGGNTGFFAVTTGGASFYHGASAYEGPVSSLQRSFVLTAADEAVRGTSQNDFVNALGGNDAIDGGGGDDVLDGGTGSNFVTGGAGRDIFFLDGRGGQVTWATVTDLSVGEEVTLWGGTPGVSRGEWVQDAGAEGFRGLTMHADLDGNGTVDASLTLTGMAAAPRSVELDGLLWFFG